MSLILPSRGGATPVNDIDFPDYTIYKEDGVIKAKNESTGNIEYTDTELANVINYINGVLPKGLISIKRDAYNVNAQIQLKSGIIYDFNGSTLTILSDLGGQYLFSGVDQPYIHLRNLEIDGNNQGANIIEIKAETTTLEQIIFENINIHSVNYGVSGYLISFTIVSPNTIKTTYVDYLKTSNVVNGGIGLSSEYINLTSLHIKDVLVAFFQSNLLGNIMASRFENVGYLNIGGVLFESNNVINSKILLSAGCYIMDNYFKATGSYATDPSFVFVELNGNTTDYIISNNYFNGAGQYALKINNVNHVIIADNIFHNIGGSSATSRGAIYINGTNVFPASNIMIHDNMFKYNAIGSYDVIIDQYTQLISVLNNHFIGSQSYVLNNSLNPDSIEIKNNFGYVTENGGSAVFSGDGVTTTFTIPHGLVSTPNTVRVTPGSQDASGQFYVTVDATNIYVNYISAPPSGTNNITLYWYAEV